MYLKMAVGTPIVLSFTSTMSKAFMFESVLPSTCGTQHRWLSSKTEAVALRSARLNPVADLIVEEAGGEDTLVIRHPVGQSGLLKSLPAVERWVDAAAPRGLPHETEHLPSCGRSGSAGLWRLVGPPLISYGTHKQENQWKPEETSRFNDHIDLVQILSNTWSNSKVTCKHCSPSAEWGEKHLKSDVWVYLFKCMGFFLSI